ncbi:hypothetical protein [Streptomyces sp. NPDC087297]|uniref:hypothetical protein n=1 Tax=Streptomyces sp. NPDC087297 TaxID=3365778 RepID=UPI0038285168
MSTMRVRAERAANTVAYGLATGAAGMLVGAVTGGFGWALAVGGTAAVAGAQAGRARPDSVTRRNKRMTAATAGYLAPLRHDGWRLIHARPIGQDPDRVYHLCVPPSASRVVVCMDWAWPDDVQIRLDENGNIDAGPVDGEIAVDWLLQAADAVRQELGANKKLLGAIGTAQVLPVHNAAVQEGHIQFHREQGDEQREINVVHRSVLVDKMRPLGAGATRRTRRSARAVAEFLDTTFP